MKSMAHMRCRFLLEVGQNWLKNDIAVFFLKNQGILGLVAGSPLAIFEISILEPEISILDRNWYYQNWI